MANGDTTWRDALILDAPRIAGVGVRPLSAWHCHVAQLLGVRLGVEDGRGPTPGDIANAIVICRSRYNPRAVGVPVAGWLLRKYLFIRWCFKSWRNDAFDLCGYVASYRRYPETVASEGKDSKPLGAPPYFAVAVDVASRLPSVTLADALNMPLLRLYCLRAVLLELGGASACAWRTSDRPEQDEIAEAFKRAQEAIERHNAKLRGQEEANAKP